jgi:hypothetical protein
MATTPDKSSQQNSSSSFNYNINYSYKLPFISYIKKIRKTFNKKYSKMPNSYIINIIDNIIYNEKSHIVASFKDRLIIDDTGEFLKRFYKKKESDLRLPKFYEYYDLYSKIFPNYTAFNEGKYLYQNIQRKQRMIDLQEKMEMEAKIEKEKSEQSKDNLDERENVFNTDAIDSILNGTNNEGMEILFSVDKNNIKKDEECFNKEVNDIIGLISEYENKKQKIKIQKNKNAPNRSNSIINNITNNVNNNKNKKSSNKDNNIDNFWNKNIFPININYSKNKRTQNSNTTKTINNTNITYYNNIQSIISKFFNDSTHPKNGILNYHNKINNTNKVNSKTKYYSKKGKNFVEKLENNLLKIRQKSTCLQKNLSQNISTSNQTQKDISISKRNSGIYTKKPSTSASSAHNNRSKSKNVNNNNSYKMSNNTIIKTLIRNKNIEIGKKGNSPLTSRNPHINKFGLTLYKNKVQSIKNIKKNTNYVPDTTSRNNHSNNLNFQGKAKSTIKGSIYNIHKVKKDTSNNSQIKSYVYNKKNEFNETIRKDKEDNYAKNMIRYNKISIKEKIFKNENKNMNLSRNKSKKKNKNVSQPKTNINRYKNITSRNDSSLKVNMFDTKRKYGNGICMNNFSKILNISNINSKNTFSKTHRGKFGLFNK